MPWTTETILKAIALAPGQDCVTEARLAELTGLSPGQVERAAGKLVKYGFLSRTARGCHKLTEAGRSAIIEGEKIRWRSGPKGRHTGQRACSHGIRQRAWNVLRMGGKRTVDDILMLVVEGGERDARGNVRRYLQALVRAGYVTVMPTREAALNPTSNGCLRYLLVRDSGPEAPVWRVSRGVVFDPNTETAVSLQEAA